MNDRSNDRWLKEYEDFLTREDLEVPKALTHKVSTFVSEAMNPRAWSVFLKVSGIHLVVGFLSLSICHQFGVNPFNTSRSLADWFMAVGGHGVCMIGCGVLFVSLSVLASGYFLTIEETRALRRTGFPQSFALGALSLALFHSVGAQLALTIAALWLFGALIGGFVATEAVWKLKYISIRRRT